MATRGTVQGTQVVKRIAALLRHVGHGNEKGIRLVDLCKAVNLEQPTAHRMLKALAVEGLVLQCPRSKRYQLGPLIAELGLAVQNKLDIREFARESLERIAAITEDTAYLIVQSRYEAVCLDRIVGSYPVKVLTLEVGGRRPLGTNASGICILGCLPESEREEIITHNTSLYEQCEGWNVQRVRDSVADFKSRGHAHVSITQGTTSLGLPVKGPNGRPLAGIAVSAIDSRIAAPRYEKIIQTMQKEINHLERLLTEQIMP